MLIKQQYRLQVKLQILKLQILKRMLERMKKQHLYERGV
jgi:hypothetical protein